MSESIISRKSKYDLSNPAMLKVPSAMYYIIKKVADRKKIHWSEVARDMLTSKIKELNK